MNDKFKQMFVAVGSSLMVLAFGITVTVINNLGKSEEKLFVDQEIEIEVPNLVEFISTTGFSIKYDDSEWNRVGEDNGYDLKLLHKKTKDELTIVSNYLDTDTTVSDLATSDAKTLKQNAKIFFINKNEIRNIGQNEYYIFGYNIGNSGENSTTNTVRYINKSNDFVVKFITSYSSEETLNSTEKLIKTYTVL